MNVYVDLVVSYRFDRLQLPECVLDLAVLVGWLFNTYRTPLRAYAR